MNPKSGGPVVVTGASGLVGRALVKALVNDGIEVRGTSRDAGALARSQPALRSTAAWPLTDPSILRNARAVVHLAGESVGNPPWSAAMKRAIESSRIDGTRSLVAAIGALPEAERPKVLVSASAIGFYGETGQRPTAEDGPKGTGFLSDLCAAWEAEALAAKQHGLRVVTPRLGLVMSVEGGALGKQLPIFKLGLGGKLGPGTQRWPVIHIDDVVGLLRFSIDDERVEGALNVTAPRPVEQKEFADVLGKILHRPTFLPAPAFAIKAALGEFSAELLESHDVVPTRALALGYAFRFPELEPMLRDLLKR